MRKRKVNESEGERNFIDNFDVSSSHKISFYSEVCLFLTLSLYLLGENENGPSEQ